MCPYNNSNNLPILQPITFSNQYKISCGLIPLNSIDLVSLCLDAPFRQMKYNNVGPNVPDYKHLWDSDDAVDFNFMADGQCLNPNDLSRYFFKQLEVGTDTMNGIKWVSYSNQSSIFSGFDANNKPYVQNTLQYSSFERSFESTNLGGNFTLDVLGVYFENDFTSFLITQSTTPNTQDNLQRGEFSGFNRSKNSDIKS